MLNGCTTCEECKYKYTKMLKCLLGMLVFWLPRSHPNRKNMWEGYRVMCKFLNEPLGKLRRRRI